MTQELKPKEIRETVYVLVKVKVRAENKSAFRSAIKRIKDSIYIDVGTFYYDYKSIGKGKIVNDPRT